MRDAGLILFLKYPAPGLVKTRIGKVLGVDSTAGLYRSFVADILHKIQAVEADLIVYFDPPDRQSDVRIWLGTKLLLFPQKGNDLGKKMENAFLEQFQMGYQRLVLIGSDIPHISSAILRESLDLLCENQAVIGPAKDGGYYLIGFNSSRFLPQVFQGIAWSTGSVFRESMAVFEKNGITAAELAMMSDIDTLDDFKTVLSAVGEAGMPESARFWDDLTGGDYGS